MLIQFKPCSKIPARFVHRTICYSAQIFAYCSNFAQFRYYKNLTNSNIILKGINFIIILLLAAWRSRHIFCRTIFRGKSPLYPTIFTFVRFFIIICYVPINNIHTRFITFLLPKKSSAIIQFLLMIMTTTTLLHF